MYSNTVLQNIKNICYKSILLNYKLYIGLGICSFNNTFNSM